uniref:Uncharacterized protein n=1 Tax=Aegilops tauschii TaxID=37682 RepID=R7WAF3_AEGTA
MGENTPSPKMKAAWLLSSESKSFCMDTARRLNCSSKEHLPELDLTMECENLVRRTHEYSSSSISSAKSQANQIREHRSHGKGDARVCAAKSWRRRTSAYRMQRRQERSFYASVAVVAAGAGKARLAVRPRSAVVSVGSCSGLDVAGKVDKGLLYDRDEEEDDDGRREWEVVYWGYIKLKRKGLQPEIKGV